MKGLDYKFKSGKFKDKTVREVVDINPDYLIYLHFNFKARIFFSEDVLVKCYKSQFQLK